MLGLFSYISYYFCKMFGYNSSKNKNLSFNCSLCSFCREEGHNIYHCKKYEEFMKKRKQNFAPPTLYQKSEDIIFPSSPLK
jgi:hypothetical protein